MAEQHYEGRGWRDSAGREGAVEVFYDDNGIAEPYPQGTRLPVLRFEYYNSTARTAHFDFVRLNNNRSAGFFDVPPFTAAPDARATQPAPGNLDLIADAEGSLAYDGFSFRFQLI